MDKEVVGGITLLGFHGVLDQAFEGHKIAQGVRTKKLLVNLREVRRFASWGMSEWMNFMRTSADHDLYFVECSTYSVAQMSLVTGLMGHGKLVSFYTPYRCTQCGEEFETLMIVPIDRAAIRDLATTQQVCATCNGSAHLDKYPAEVCAALADREPFDIDDEVLAFLRSQLKYNLVPDTTRFRAYRKVNGNYTYMRLTGNVATLPVDTLAKQTENTTVVDLANILFDTRGLAAWRSFVQGALDPETHPGGKPTTLQLLDCPPGFLETSMSPDDVDPRLQVRTFGVWYDCVSCQQGVTVMIDVAENLEQLSEGLLPPHPCPNCKAPLAGYLGPDQAVLRKLPARERDDMLDKFLSKVRQEPADKLEDCLVARTAAPGVERKKSGKLLAAALGVVVLGGGTALAVQQLTKPEPTAEAPVTRPAIDPKPPAPTFQRPDWITSDTPSSAFCHDMINRLMCVGVSSYRATRNEAVAEANDTALEELVNAVGLKISNPFFKDRELPGYSDARAKALSALSAADMDRTSTAYAKALEEVRKARRRVVEIFQTSGGAAVPTQRSDWYWEEYAKEKGAGTELLVFVRYDVSLDEVKALVEKYSVQTPALGSTVMTAFPSLAWQHADFTGGAILTKVGRPFRERDKVSPGDIIMMLGDQRVSDAPSFARQFADWAKGKDDTKVTIKPTSGAPRVLEIER